MAVLDYILHEKHNSPFGVDIEFIQKFSIHFYFYFLLIRVKKCLDRGEKTFSSKIFTVYLNSDTYDILMTKGHIKFNLVPNREFWDF